MKKIILLSVICLSGALTGQIHAQSIRNTNWKIFVAGDLNDSITLHIFSDSTMATNSSGMMLVRSGYTLSGDTLTLKDVDGPYACLGMNGVYKIKLDNSRLTMSLVSDICTGRAQTLDGVTWIKAPGPIK